MKGVLRGGLAWDEIVRVAKEEGCDLIVTSTHGRTGLGHFFLGSVAERVVRASPVPVVTVPLRARQGEAKTESAPVLLN